MGTSYFATASGPFSKSKQPNLQQTLPKLSMSRFQSGGMPCENICPSPF
jgi:hypothetical protein